jgi:hypothetical protein
MLDDLIVRRPGSAVELCFLCNRPSVPWARTTIDWMGDALHLPLCDLHACRPQRELRTLAAAEMRNYRKVRLHRRRRRIFAQFALDATGSCERPAVHVFCWLCVSLGHERVHGRPIGRGPISASESESNVIVSQGMKPLQD